MGWMSWSLETYLDSGSASNMLEQFLYAVIATIILAILYAWIVINYRKKEIATLKCIGYTNSNIRTLIIGELVFVTVFAFVLLLEGLIHWTAFNTYTGTPTYGNMVETSEPLLSMGTIGIVVGMFLVSQIIGILIMYRKILRLRPIVALRVLK